MIADAYVGPASRDPTSLKITITAPVVAPPLTLPNVVKYYGIYLDDVTYDIIPASSTEYTFLNLNPDTVYKISASSIDLYNETLVGARSTVLISSGTVVVSWPPANYDSTKILQTARTPIPTPNGPYFQVANPGVSGSLVGYHRDTTFYQSFQFTIIPKSTLTNICLQINSDDGFKITFTGLQPETSVLPLPNPILNLTGTNLSPATGGQYQYSQPITLLENQIYPVQIDYYNLKNLNTGAYTPSVFAITYVTPTAASPWSLGWRNTCPALDVLLLQNLMQFCFIPT
jgi:hypothetical protein